MSKMYETIVKLNPEQFRVILGFDEERLSSLLILSPIVSSRLILQFYPHAEIIQTIWARSAHFQLGLQDCILFSPLPGAFHHLELLNFLTITPGKRLYFFGAAGLLDDNLKPDRLYGCSEVYCLDIVPASMTHTVNHCAPCWIPEGLQDLPLVSSHLISLETPAAIRTWQKMGIKAIDMEIGYLSDYLTRRQIEFYPVIFGTDYPQQGDTFMLDGKRFTRAIPELLHQFFQLIQDREG